MTPQAGQIWKWSGDLYVLLIEEEIAGYWKGLDLEDGTITIWAMIDMKYWRHIA